MAVNFGIQTQQGGTPRQGECVDRLQIGLSGVLVVLAGFHAQEQTVKMAINLNRLQCGGKAFGADQL